MMMQDMWKGRSQEAFNKSLQILFDLLLWTRLIIFYHWYKDMAQAVEHLHNDFEVFSDLLNKKITTEMDRL